MRLVAKLNESSLVHFCEIVYFCKFSSLIMKSKEQINQAFILALNTTQKITQICYNKTIQHGINAFKRFKQTTETIGIRSCLPSETKIQLNFN